MVAENCNGRRKFPLLRDNYQYNRYTRTDRRSETPVTAHYRQTAIQHAASFTCPGARRRTPTDARNGYIQRVYLTDTPNGYTQRIHPTDTPPAAHLWVELDSVHLFFRITDRGVLGIVSAANCPEPSREGVQLPTHQSAPIRGRTDDGGSTEEARRKRGGSTLQ